MSRKIRMLVVHHSATPMKSTTVEGIRREHKKKFANGIGYHRLITSDGTIVQGRADKEVGAHAYGVNHSSLGVCVIGNFMKEEPTLQQLESLVDVLAEWCRAHKLGIGAIYGHGSAPGGKTPTLCPGSNMNSKLGIVKAAVAAEIGRRNVASR
jgi:N-acetylmuramoyl-L-alanine amidase